LGMSNGIIPDSSLTASSHRSGLFGPEQGRLGNPRFAWSPRPDDASPFFQVDLGENYYITAISTKGHPVYNEYVKKYLMRYSNDGKKWKTVSAEPGIPKVTFFSSKRMPMFTILM
ncbi:predicted protein, partial [Nematostella vectensis]